MAVILFKAGLEFKDAGELQNKLLELGLTPKCLEPEEQKEPSWRETTNFVHRRVDGSWKWTPETPVTRTTKEMIDDELHVHKYLSGNRILLVEETSERSDIVDLTDELPPDMHLSFGNGVFMARRAGYNFCWVVVDHKLKKQALEVIELIRT